MADSKSDGQGGEPRTGWALVRLDEYRTPRGPAGESVKRGLRRMITGLATRRKQEPAGPRAKLQPVSDDVLKKVAPEPDWSVAAEAVEDAWGAWADDKGGGVRIAAHAPGSGTREVLQAWAVARGFQPVSSPGADEVLAGGEKWFKRVRSSGSGALFIPNLERCYLRDSSGLGLIRQVRDWLPENPQKVIACIDSWAWAFLARAIEFHSVLPSPMVLRPFDHESLETWLRSTMHGTDCREWPGGRYVVCATRESHDSRSSEDQSKRKKGEPGESDFLRNLAAHARGLGGVALEIWRNSLKLAEEIREEDAKQAPSWSPDALWVPVWGRVDLPGLPAGTGDSERFVLYGLLLHGGLSADLLIRLLPLSPNETMRVLHQLQSARIVERADAEWRVTLSGYPAARSALSSNGFVVDGV